MTVRGTVRGQSLTDEPGSSLDPASERARLLTFARAYARLCARSDWARARSSSPDRPAREVTDAQDQ